MPYTASGVRLVFLKQNIQQNIQQNILQDLTSQVA